MITFFDSFIYLVKYFYLLQRWDAPNRLEDGYSIEGLIDQDTVEIAESQIELIPIQQNREIISLK